MKVAATGHEAQTKLIAGANYLADAVKVTLGPKGMNFALEKGNRITNDGITIARELIGTQEDEIEERGAKILLEAAAKANDEAGDGSTTTITLAQAILQEAVKYLPREGIFKGKKSPFELIKQIEEERVIVTEKLLSLSENVESEEQLIQVATVSVEDEELGKLIGAAQYKLGKEGYLLAEETNDRTSSVDLLNGIRIDNGFGSQAVVNNPEKEALEVADVKVIFTNHTITDLKVIAPTLDSLVKAGFKDIVVVARAFTEVAIRTCIQNMQQGTNIFPLNAPYVDQAEVMYDLQAVLGGRFINSDTDDLKSLTLSDVGNARRIFAKRMETVFTGQETDESKERVLARLEVLQKKFDGSGSDFEKRMLSARMAQLKNGFGIVKVGALTETERKYKKDKADDAVNAVRAALQEGIVPGAGQALKTIAETLPDDSILKAAIVAPYNQIMANAGGTFEIPDWIKDSTRVTRISLEKACSVASTLATAAGAVATEKPKDKCCGQTTSAQE